MSYYKKLTVLYCQFWSSQKSLHAFILFALSCIFSAVAQAAPFVCDGTAYTVIGSPSTGQSLDQTTFSPTSLGLFTPSTAVNGISYNILDNYIYGYSGGQIVRYDDTLTLEFLGVPTGTGSFSPITFTGTMDTSGNFYGISRTEIYIIDIGNNPAAGTLTYTTIARSGYTGTLADLAFSVTDGMIYGMSAGRLYQIDPVSGFGQQIAVTGDSLAGSAGGAWSTADGFVYMYFNGGGRLFKIDLKEATPLVSELANVDANGAFDATACTPPVLQKSVPDMTLLPGAVFDYTFTISNPSPTPVAIDFADTLPTGLVFEPVPGALSDTSPGGGTVSTFTTTQLNIDGIVVSGKNLSDPTSGIVTFTATVKLDANITEPISLDNQATGSFGTNVIVSDDPNSGPLNDPVTVDVVIPSLAIAKPDPLNADNDGSGDISEGDVLTYTVTATADGTAALSNVVVSDDLIVPSIENCAIVAAGDACVLVGDYTVKPEDVVAGTLTNMADADSTETDAVDTQQTVTIPQPSLTVDKPAPSNADNDANGEVSLGDNLTYTVTAMNDGTANLVNVVVSDNKITPNSKTCPLLTPGQTCVLTGVYQVSAGDVTALKVVNIATADSLQTDPVSDDETVVILAPSLAINKSDPTHNDVDGSGDIGPGDILTYTITATNDGDATLTNIMVSDPLITPNSEACISLTPTETCVLTGTYTVAATDVGTTINNTANANSDQSGPVMDTNMVTVAAALPELSIVKNISSGDPYIAVGDNIVYSYLVTNTGNVIINSVAVSDDKIATVSCPLTQLLPNQSTTCNATYVVNQDDLDDGSVVNEAIANGDPVAGTLVPPMTTQTANATQTTLLTLAKNIASGDPYSIDGGVITYAFVLTNKGNVSLDAPFTIDDDLTLDEACPTTPISLLPDESITCTASYAVEQLDLDNGSVTNNATAAAQGPAGAVNSNADTAIAVAASNPGLSIDKEVTNGNPYSATDATINYSYLVTNVGNLTVNSITVTDDKIVAQGGTVSCNDTTLLPLQTTLCTASYLSGLSDLNAGSVVNEAFAVGQAGSVTVTSPKDSETAVALTSPELSVDKQFVGTNTYSAVGDELQFSYTITNSGDVTLMNVTVTDNLIANLFDSANPTQPCPIVTLNPPAGATPGESLSCVGTYVVDQTDLDNGTVTNLATGSGAPAVGPVITNTDEETASAIQRPELSVLKTAAPMVFASGNTTINYQFLVTNTGNVKIDAPFAINDDKTSNENCPSTPTTLAPMESITCSASLQTSQLDVDAGEIVNEASVSGVGPNMVVVQSELDSVIVTADQAPELTTLKTVNSIDNAIVAPFSVSNEGDQVLYDISVQNTGNVTLSAINVTDPKADSGSISCAPSQPFDLAINAIANCTALHTLTQAEIDAGQVDNTATAKGFDPQGGDVVDDSDDPSDVIPDSPTIALLVSEPTLNLNKSIVSGVPFDTLNAPIVYDYLVTNTGNVSISAVVIVDDKIPSVTCPATVLQPGDSLNCSGTYLVTQNDLNQGTVVNIANASGVPANGVLMPATDTRTAQGIRSPALTIDKTVTGGTPFSAVNDVVTYDYLVENTGNVTISNIAVSDDKIATISCSPTILQPMTSVVCTGSYSISQVDLDAGKVVNIAAANGTPAGGLLMPPTDTETANSDPQPEITLSKDIVSGDNYIAVGDNIVYEYIVNNIGNVTIDNLTVNDDKIATVSCLLVSLPPSTSTTCTGVYIVDQMDLDTGSVINLATASGDPADGSSLPPKDATETANAMQTALLTMNKMIVSGDPYNMATDVVRYEFVLSNDGNVTLPGPFVVSDDKTSDETCPAIPSSLAPGEQVVCTASYSVIQADLDAGSVVNSAFAEDGNGLVSNTDMATAVANSNPSLAMDKEILSGTPYVAIGDVINYQYTVTNTGNLTVTGLAVNDDKIASTDINCALITLLPNQSTTCDASFTISTQAQIDAGSVANEAFATGTASGATVTSPKDVETASAVQDSVLQLDKQFDALNTYSTVGELITFTYTAVNVGNVSLTGVTIADDKIPMLFDQDSPTVVCPTVTLLPNQSLVCVGTYEVTQADIDFGTITNIATSSGLNPGLQSTDAQDDEVASAVQEPALTIDKVLASGDNYFAVGDVIEYTYEIFNEGNVTMKAPFTVMDDKIAFVDCPTDINGGTTLGPSESFECAAQYVVTQIDLDVGEVTNVASATGLDINNVLIESTTDTVTANADQQPNLGTIKTSTLDDTLIVPANQANVGDVINYVIRVENTGNVTVTATNVIDGNADAGSIVCVPSLPLILEVDGINSVANCTAKHTLTLADIDAGKVINTAVASGLDPNNMPVMDDSDDPTDADLSDPDNDGDADGPTVTLLDQSPSMTLVKTISGGNPFVEAGNIVNYRYLVTNTGNVTINNVTVFDDKIPLVSCPLAQLLPGDFMVCTASYEITPNDVIVGSITNIATTEGSPAGGILTNPTSTATADIVLATVNGHLYEDTNGDGIQGVGEPDLVNVDVVVTDLYGVMQTVTTDLGGNWSAQVPQGNVISDIDESDSDYPTDSVQTEGTDSTTSFAAANDTTFTDNDGLFLPAVINGHLYEDTNGNGIQDGAEPDLINVDVVVTNANGNDVIVTTDSVGNWQASVPPGSTTITIDTIDPDFPSEFSQTQGTDPTTIEAVAGETLFTDNDGFLPMLAWLGLSKRLEALPEELAGSLWRVAYLLDVSSNVNMTDVQVVDDLAAVFVFIDPLSYIVTDISSADLVVNSNFDGGADKNILDVGNTLNANEIKTIRIEVEIEIGVYPGPYDNTAEASALGHNGLTFADTSQDGALADANSNDSPADDSEPTPAIFGADPTLPISLSWVYPYLNPSAKEVVVEWRTQTEVGNLGFNVFARIDGQWQLQNALLIQSKGDSTVLQDYRFVIQGQEAQYYAIADIDVYGNSILHGPFKLGKQHGVRSTNTKAKVYSFPKPVLGETSRMRQMRERNLQRKQSRN